MDLYNERFPWQEGAYAVEVELRIAGVKEPTKQNFSFRLTSGDVQRLHQNLDEVERYVRELIQPPAAAASINYHWNWVYPHFGPAALRATRP